MTPRPKRPKVRLDEVLAVRGLAESRARAHALVLAGRVYSGEVRLEKPGQKVDPDLAVEIRGDAHPWASRGGLKLAHGLATFGIDPAGRVCLDIGASTGGFTDVLLHGGAARVFSVDVGRGQLDWRLRQDARVVVLDEINARYLTRELVPDAVDLIVCDASFIGLQSVLPAPLELAADAADLVALIKPQFEVGPERVGKGGVVRDAALHVEVCDRMRAWLEARRWGVLGVTESPVRGPKGNVEFLIAARRQQ